MKYPIAIEPGDESRAWSVIVADLPGCFSAAGSGIDEVIENAKEAIELWVETALDAGEDIPKPSRIAVFQKNVNSKVGFGR
jgi:predicted RNase H-like HicB family nuclease